MSAHGIPQIAVVMGSCTAGGAYVPAMSDETVIVRGTGTIFIGGPPLVKAATGQDVTAEELGGADVHTRRSVSPTTTRPPTSTRSRSHAGSSANLHTRKPEPPWDVARAGAAGARSGRPLRLDPGGLPPADGPRELIARIVDGSRFQEFKALYGETLVSRLRAHRGLSPSGSSRTTASSSPSRRRRARTSSSSACKRRIPIVFLQNITGFMVGIEYEAGGIARDGAKLVMAVANAQVPKFTVVTGGSFGAGNYAMCGRAYEPRQLWMWPNARISVMGGEQAATVLTMVGDVDERGDPREVRGARATPTTRPRASGTTGSSTRSTPGACSRSGSQRR